MNDHHPDHTSTSSVNCRGWIELLGWVDPGLNIQKNIFSMIDGDGLGINIVLGYFK